MPDENKTNTSDNTAEERMLDTLNSILKTVASPDIVEAQAILLRRLALQGDVVNSRIPAPRNITEIGGYINLLATLNQPEMKSQMIASILGVAGPNPPLGWIERKPVLTMLSFVNDRPEGPAQPSIPLNFSVRSDFFDFVKVALKTLHDQGCLLPLIGSNPSLPQVTTGTKVTQDVLPYLGRTLDIVRGTALVDPATDAIAVARPAGSNEPFQIVARVLKSGTVAVQKANWEALKCDGTKCTQQIFNDVQYVSIKSALASAGFYSASPLPQPITKTATSWAHFTNISGLIPGVTKLGDELTLLYSISDIYSSILADCMNWVWNGTQFVPI